jgi:IPT/TIG domain/FG-GAP repeat
MVGAPVRLHAWLAAAALLLGVMALMCGLASGRVRPRSPTRAYPAAWLSLHDGRPLLHVDARGARHPLRIDPLIQQDEKLTGGGESGEGLFGASVALSADGDTALVGAPSDDGGVGAAWVFTRSGSTWSQQGGKLTGAGESGRAAFGTGVALSGDGDTAVIGGPFDGGGAGAAWVFTRSGSTWTQLGEKLTGGGESGGGAFGRSVALSSDGGTVVIGGPFDAGRAGAAWVFTRSGSTWAQQGGKLTGGGESGDGLLGSSLALSAGGETALVGGEGDDGGVGGAWVFTRAGATWSQQGERLTGAGEAGEGLFGSSVALSAGGETALVGGEGDDGGVGGAWVFTRTGATWSQQGEKLTGRTGADKAFFGYSVALSADGDSALIGGHDYNDVGAVWAFARSSATWRQTQQLAGGGEAGFGAFGSGVALSSDGSTALIGGQGDDDFVGAAWVFASKPSPTVSGVRRRSGPESGGVPVTITGANFTAVTDVSFGSHSAASFSVDSATSITAITPPEPPGSVNVTVTTVNGTSALSGKDRYRFTPCHRHNPGHGVTGDQAAGRDRVRSERPAPPPAGQRRRRLVQSVYVVRLYVEPVATDRFILPE